jgi:hypothetical protein
LESGFLATLTSLAAKFNDFVGMAQYGSEGSQGSMDQQVGEGHPKVQQGHCQIANVQAAQLTGVDENQKININIALVKGKVDVPSSRCKDMNPGDWM